METDNFEAMENLARKIRLQRGVHDIFQDRLEKISKAQKVINVIFSSFVTLIVFADFGLFAKILPEFSGTPVMLTVGLLSFALFVINSLSDVFQITSRQLSHQKAIENYTVLLSDLKVTSQAEIPLAQEMLEQLVERYLRISSDAINFGGNEFDKAQKKYLKKRAAIYCIRKNPYIKWYKLRSEAEQTYKQALENEGRINGKF
jgi:hypothetical protein